MNIMVLFLQIRCASTKIIGANKCSTKDSKGATCYPFDSHFPELWTSKQWSEEVLHSGVLADFNNDWIIANMILHHVCIVIMERVLLLLRISWYKLYPSNMYFCKGHCFWTDSFWLAEKLASACEGADKAIFSFAAFHSLLNGQPMVNTIYCWWDVMMEL